MQDFRNMLEGSSKVLEEEEAKAKEEVVVKEDVVVEEGREVEEE